MEARVVIRIIGRDEAGPAVNETRRGLQGLQGQLTDLGRQLLGFLGLRQLIRELRQATTAAASLQASMLGLASVAQAFGQDAMEAQRAAVSLSNDGLMTVAQAATGLKNLLAAGFGLPEAITLMERFKDAAAFNRQAALSFGQAIASATEGIKNGNSILVDNAGVTKNLSVILEEAGFSAQDLMRASQDAGVRMAIFQGIVRETAPFLGNARDLANSAAGEIERMGVRSEQAAQEFGLKLQPVVQKLAQTFNEVLLPVIRHVIGYIETIGATAGLLWGLLENVNTRVDITLQKLRATAFTWMADMIARARDVPLLGTLLGITNLDEAYERALRVQAVHSALVVAQLQDQLLTVEQLWAIYRDKLADIRADMNREGPPVPFQTPAGRGTRTPSTATTSAAQQAADAVRRQIALLRAGAVSSADFRASMDELVPQLMALAHQSNVSTDDLQKLVAAIEAAHDALDNLGDGAGESTAKLSAAALKMEAVGQQLGQALIQGFQSAIAGLGDLFAEVIAGGTVQALTQLRELKAEEMALQQAYDSGSISLQEYNRQLAEIQRQRAAAESESPLRKFAAGILNTLGDLAIGLATFALLYGKFRTLVLHAPFGVAAALFAGGALLKAAAARVGATVNGLQGNIGGAVGSAAASTSASVAGSAEQQRTITIVNEGPAIWDLSDPRVAASWARALSAVTGSRVLITGPNALNPVSLGG